MKESSKQVARREPRQRRSRFTVDSILDAVAVVLKQHGPNAVTTNRISEAAGFSIGSLYQYFPDKQAIYGALHERHVNEVRRVIADTVEERFLGSFANFTCALVEALAKVHASDPRLHRLVTALVPEGPAVFRAALHKTFEEVITSADDETKRMLFVLSGLIESLVHGIAEWPPLISNESAREDAVKIVRLYLGSCPALQMRPHSPPPIA